MRPLWQYRPVVLVLPYPLWLLPQLLEFLVVLSHIRPLQLQSLQVELVP